MTAKIVFACTNYGPIWAPAVESWLRCISRTTRDLVEQGRGCISGTGISDRCYTSSSENQQIAGFLAQQNATHLFWTESDMILPDDAILKLLEIDKPIASGVYFLRDGWGQPCLYKQVVKMRKRRREKEAEWQLYSHTPVTIFPQDEPFKLGDSKSSGVPGFGCVLIKREVLEAMTPPWCEISEGKHGSDMYFYKHACDAGAEVWIHPGVMCGQIDYNVFSVEDYYDRMAEDPEFGGSGYIIGMPEKEAKR
ncbi:MAG: hypothetical protein ACR2QC_11885 [Gammaproteobacteria bacterium]